MKNYKYVRFTIILTGMWKVNAKKNFDSLEKLKQYLLGIEADDYYIFDREPYACLATIWKHIDEIEKERGDKKE